jgi:hypothetical protein
MSIFLIALALAAFASFFGAFVARIIAALPEAVLASSANGGRYAGLGSSDRSSSVSPSKGLRIHPVAAPHGTLA